MTKINITKPTGEVETLALLSAFEAENSTYIIFDSERIGSMGLPIIYISKYTEKLEKITDTNEWQSVKNYLKGIINGANFLYIKVNENLISDEVYYTPLTLPTASFDIVKSRYVVEDSGESPVLEPVNEVPAAPIMPDSNVESNSEVVSTPIMPVVDNIPSATLIDAAHTVPVVEPISPVPTIEPIPEVASLENPVENVIPEVTPIVVPEAPVTDPLPNVEPAQTSLVDTPVENTNAINFEMDKETFLKACENMFDALVSKYQKELTDLERREEALAKKEQEINNKMASASEALANAEAKEQVANIAHDNAQKIMDLSSIMPHPEETQTGVI